MMPGELCHVLANDYQAHSHDAAGFRIRQERSFVHSANESRRILWGVPDQIEKQIGAIDRQIGIASFSTRLRMRRCSPLEVTTSTRTPSRFLKSSSSASRSNKVVRSVLSTSKSR